MYGKIDFVNRADGRPETTRTGIVRNEFIMNGDTYYHVLVDVSEEEKEIIFLVKPIQISKYYNDSFQGVVNIEMPERTTEDSYYLWDYKEQKYFCGTMGNISWSEDINQCSYANKDTINLMLKILENGCDNSFIEIRNDLVNA